MCKRYFISLKILTGSLLLSGFLSNAMDMDTPMAAIMRPPVPRAAESPRGIITSNHNSLRAQAIQRLDDAFTNDEVFRCFANMIASGSARTNWRDFINVVMPIDGEITDSQPITVNDFSYCPVPYAWGFDSTGMPFITVAFVYGFPENDRNDERIIIQTFALNDTGAWNTYVWHRFEDDRRNYSQRPPLTFDEVAELILDTWIKRRQTPRGGYSVKLANRDTIRRVLNPNSSSMG